jgi:hypothetical protein
MSCSNTSTTISNGDGLGKLRLAIALRSSSLIKKGADYSLCPSGHKAASAHSIDLCRTPRILRLCAGGYRKKHD